MAAVKSSRRTVASLARLLEAPRFEVIPVQSHRGQGGRAPPARR